MDSPHLLHLGFLLLALAAPRPNIAMSTVGLAEGTEDSSSGSTAVTVHHCNSSTCTCESSPNDSGNFKKIAETQSKTLSDVIIEFVTNETHTTVCFEQENSCIEGMYHVQWEKAGKNGFSCYILNSGENGRGNTSTEKNICCEAETSIWRHNPPMKCYTQKSHPKPNTLPVGAPEGIIGKPEFLTSKKNNIALLFAFLFVVACIGWATTYYFLRQRRRGQAAFRQYKWDTDKENLTNM